LLSEWPLSEPMGCCRAASSPWACSHRRLGLRRSTMLPLPLADSRGAYYAAAPAATVDGEHGAGHRVGSRAVAVVVGERGLGPLHQVAPRGLARGLVRLVQLFDRAAAALGRRKGCRRVRPLQGLPPCRTRVVAYQGPPSHFKYYNGWILPDARAHDFWPIPFARACRAKHNISVRYCSAPATAANSAQIRTGTYRIIKPCWSQTRCPRCPRAACSRGCRCRSSKNGGGGGDKMVP
jgi:hypothetical protein